MPQNLYNIIIIIKTQYFISFFYLSWNSFLYILDFVRFDFIYCLLFYLLSILRNLCVYTPTVFIFFIIPSHLLVILAFQWLLLLINWLILFFNLKLRSIIIFNFLLHFIFLLRLCIAFFINLFERASIWILICSFKC